VCNSRTLLARWFALVGLVLAINSGALSAESAPASLAPLRWETEITSGILWKFGGGATHLHYVLLPQIISFKIPPISERPWAGGTLVFRSRFSLLLEPIVRGPEHAYLGTAAAGEVEWRSATGAFTGFFSSGGGFGWMDSKGYEVPGGQGQDFNLNWLIHTGVRFRTAHAWHLSLGLYFQHISNRGLDKINPGLNALGPTLGVSRKF
jgi:lipid A 3-O-deacylase